ncbi:polyamine-transporting ATPase 13A3-like, partial [Atheta coriaria]|uniref:polyamine-transporting ATPase 13A3-like n=1 Tax=Dalotia coriaria TaxID=877792 RepID=UPI0031F3EDB6
MKFVTCLFIVASIGMIYCIYLYAMRNAEIREMIIRALDIITIVVPPAMPAAMTVGIVYSQSRLRKLQIFCISPPRIPICGKIKLACFDKTGTLTHEGLELYSVLPSQKSTFSEPVEDVTILDAQDPIVQAMATCHTLTRIDGKINGDPLDINMFECTKWILEEPGDEETNYDVLAPTVVKPDVKFKSSSKEKEFLGDLEDINYEIGIIKQFQFASSLQRMSVICRVLGARNMKIFSKGAPEKIESMCLSETIPQDFNTKLAEFTAQGFRVIALAYKDLPAKFKWKDAQKVKREQVECDLTFLGFIVMQNTLKEETTPIISALHSANIRTVMITGDNVMTAICVARECGMIGINDDVLLLQ